MEFASASTNWKRPPRNPDPDIRKRGNPQKPPGPAICKPAPRRFVQTERRLAMKVAVTATDRTLDASVDPRFGRCPYFLVVETDDLSFEPLENPNLTLGGGAGIQSAQLMADHGVQHVLTGNCGPNAHQTLSAAGIGILIGCSGVVRDVIEQYRAGQLAAATEPNVASKFGMGSTSGAAMGSGVGGNPAFGPGMGGGRGMGMGRGGGRGMGMGGGMGQGSGMGYGGGLMGPQVVSGSDAGAPDELTVLKQQAEAMARQMQQMQQRIQELEQEKDSG
jgi:predicted Fe-Mo cluster-binding NifX family protein